MRDSNYTECHSWNCCDENLQACIDKSKYVRKIRKQLKNKKFEKNSDKLFTK
ncbi:MAG: hypothetical protein HWN81_15265 [Candidatus Lokiarchaeota archaeon]|nr:hypothetical protein [Candidatus Lokiarchaeota archaeon]